MGKIVWLAALTLVVLAQLTGVAILVVFALVNLAAIRLRAVAMFRQGVP